MELDDEDYMDKVNPNAKKPTLKHFQFRQQRGDRPDSDDSGSEIGTDTIIEYYPDQDGAQNDTCDACGVNHQELEQRVQDARDGETDARTEVAQYQDIVSDLEQRITKLTNDLERTCEERDNFKATAEEGFQRYTRLREAYKQKRTPPDDISDIAPNTAGQSVIINAQRQLLAKAAPFQPKEKLRQNTNRFYKALTHWLEFIDVPREKVKSDGLASLNLIPLENMITTETNLGYRMYPGLNGANYDLSMYDFESAAYTMANGKHRDELKVSAVLELLESDRFPATLAAICLINHCKGFMGKKENLYLLICTLMKAAEINTTLEQLRPDHAGMIDGWCSQATNRQIAQVMDWMEELNHQATNWYLSLKVKQTKYKPTKVT